MTDAENGVSDVPAANGHSEVAVEDRDRANEERVKANEHFKQKHYGAAIDGYTRALELDPDSPTVLSNRSFAHLRLEEYGSAVADADAAIALDPKLPKGYYRRGDANFALGNFKKARADFLKAAKLAPKDVDLRRKLAEAERIVKRMRFEESLSVPEAEVIPVSQTIDLTTMTVEDSYDGPRLEGSDEEGYTITEGFVSAMLERFREQKKIHTRFAFEIVMGALRVFQQLPTLVDVDIPSGESFTVCGDVHGQFYDLLNIFELNGVPSTSKPYLFNGDFVDRGSFSAEVILTLFAYKWLLPQHIHLARGNHESRSMNSIYGFDGEVKAKYNGLLVELFREVFCHLPLAHCLNSKVLVVHGGLFSQDGVTLDDLRKVDRNMEPPGEGLMCEMLWSDPQPQQGRSPSKRGVGVAFGPDVTKRFLSENNLDLIVRSHEVKDEGYEIEHDGYLITIFSAPNYCDQMGNKGAFITFKGDDLTPQFTQYSAVSHPSVRPMQYAGGMMSQLMGM
mmetsp:Transcript_1680/g.4867  ORF Transcript_1680/g.4867 Transcript_1680/m.4867 type:complete len:507 (+) Transcript_1680:201-1721(+)|eukprot:CAMPEP_0206143780 /NCGR_PEP_ID=MMETSP1473-20131121/21779_1 /ASSEMBLY_ACC=CAM_ASM_001109 /TAXON_ID=1461547 /ORGANISM="Stichococcus sp, Strain RCC1054" /LENGTH=506 /DNA_ID=CAMNT_0053539339 /DNA_START=105 /DNA_END=1625 /DNA_ORIENTATION=+